MLFKGLHVLMAENAPPLSLSRSRDNCSFNIEVHISDSFGFIFALPE